MEKINVLKTDTAQTLFVRVAALHNSIPKYIYLVDAPMEQGKELGREGQQSTLDINAILKLNFLETQVIDMLNAIRTIPTPTDFSKFLKANLTYFSGLETVDDIIKPWLFYRFGEGIEPEYMDLILFSYVDTINKELKMTYEINFINFNSQAKLTINDIEKTINDIKKRNQDILASYKEVDAVTTTPFELEKVKYSIQISEKFKFTLAEIFNDISTSQEFPYAQYNNFYKIFKGFVPRVEWDYQTQNIITVKYNTGKIEKISQGGKETSKQIFEDIKILYDNGNCYILIDISVENKDVNATIDKILNIFVVKKQVIKKDTVSIKGVCYIPNQDIDRYIFSHLVMNDSNFSRFVIDDLAKLNREKPSQYVYYNNGKDMDKLVITSKVMSRFDPTMRNKDSKIFPENQVYTRIRINTGNEEMIGQIISDIGRIIAIYNLKYEETLKLYKKFIKGFKVSEHEVVQPKKDKGRKGKESRKCTHPPVVISESEIPQYKDYMIYPLPEDVNNPLAPRIYACKPSEKKPEEYVGLQLRKDTKDYVPCCFKIDQKEKIGSDYNKYLKYLKTGVQQQKTIGLKQQRLIKTNKILLYKQFSNVIPNADLENILKINDDTVEYFRNGVHRSKMSMLTCLLEIFREQGEELPDSYEFIKNITENEHLLSLVKQHRPDLSIQEIKIEMLNPETYIDPKYYTTLFEEIFDTRIFTFNATQIIPPFFKKNLLTYNIQRKHVVVLIEHYGSESDNAQYPQCETITWGVEDPKYTFPINSQLFNILDKMIKTLTQSYIMGKEVEEYNIPQDVKSQVFDSFGKVSAFISLDNITLFTKRPYPPLPLPEYIGPTLLSKSGKIYKDFTTVNGKSNKDFVYVETGDSDINIFNQYSKLSKYIMEYVYYAYSNYTFKNKLNIRDIDSVSRFANDVMEVVDNIQYGELGRFFTTNDRIYDGKVKVPNYEILKRCIYALRLEIQHDYQKIEDYRTRHNIASYIDSLADFTKYPSENMLYGIGMLERYIIEILSQQRVSYIGIQQIQPFFIRFINNRVWLAQNVSNLNDAYSICTSWKNKRRNILSTVSETHFPIYKISRDGNNIMTDQYELISGREDFKIPQIIGFKINGVKMFTVLLNL